MKYFAKLQSQTELGEGIEKRLLADVEAGYGYYWISPSEIQMEDYASMIERVESGRSYALYNE